MHKISTKELLGVIISLTCSLFPLFGTSLIISIGENTSLISITIGYLIGFIPLLLILSISKNLDNKTLPEYNVDKFKFLGRILNILIYIYIFYVGLLLSWRIVNFTITNLLSKTSFYTVSIILFSITAYAVIKGKEVINRSTFILTIILIIFILFSYIFLIPNIKLDNFLPIFNIEKESFIKSIFLFPTISVFPLISILSIKGSDIVDRNNLKKIVILGYSITYVIIMIFVLCTIGSYGSNFSSILSYPEYYLFKSINAFDFIQRGENILAMSFYIISYGSICYLIYFGKECLTKAFNIVNQKLTNSLIFIISNGVPLLGIYLFQKYHLNYLFTNYIYYSCYIFIILIVNFILIKISKRKRNQY